MAWAWIITRDYVEGPDAEPDSRSLDHAVGLTGPRSAPDHLIRQLEAGKGHAFRMLDDDGILYYRGRGIADDGDEGSEDFCFAPLDNFGMPNAGAVTILWHGHPEWDCG